MYLESIPPVLHCVAFWNSKSSFSCIVAQWKAACSSRPSHRVSRAYNSVEAGEVNPAAFGKISIFPKTRKTPYTCLNIYMKEKRSVHRFISHLRWYKEGNALRFRAALWLAMRKQMRAVPNFSAKRKCHISNDLAVTKMLALILKYF